MFTTPATLVSLLAAALSLNPVVAHPRELSITIEIDTDKIPTVHHGLKRPASAHASLDADLYPDDLLYTKTHMWTTRHTIDFSRPFGITAFAATKFGPLFYLGSSLDHGDEIKPGTTIATLAYDEEALVLYKVVAAADGFVWTRNATTVEEVKKDCYGEGALGTWLTGDDLAEYMLNKTEYVKHLEWEEMSIRKETLQVEL